MNVEVKFPSGTSVVHQDNPQWGMGIVFATNERGVCRVAWAGLEKPFISEHNQCFLLSA